MGLSFYLKSVGTIGFLVLLFCITWNTGIKVVRELSPGNTILDNVVPPSRSKLSYEDCIKQNNPTGESRHVAFLKVHKTGSSSVQNIFLRFGETRNLTFILAHDNVELAETKFPNVISYSNTLTDKNIVPPPEGRHYDLLCCHVIYNYTQFNKYLPPDTKYIGLVRDPITRLESALRYFNLFTDITLSTYAEDPLKFERGAHSMSNNRMAFEFGYPLNLFPNSYEKPDNLEGAIKDYTDKVLGEFTLILINERMEESLVLMKRMLNWHIKDIMYMKQLVAKQETRKFSETDIFKLKSFLYLDFYLYQRSLDVFDEKVTRLGDDFQSEVELFKTHKEKITEFCRAPDEAFIEFDENKWNSGYTITKEDCKLYTLFEIKFVKDIMLRQYGHMNN